MNEAWNTWKLEEIRRVDGWHQRASTAIGPHPVMPRKGHARHIYTQNQLASTDRHTQIHRPPTKNTKQHNSTTINLYSSTIEIQRSHIKYILYIYICPFTPLYDVYCLFSLFSFPAIFSPILTKNSSAYLIFF